MILGDIGKHFNDCGWGDRLEIQWVFVAGLRHPQILGILLVGNKLVYHRALSTTIQGSFKPIQEILRPRLRVLRLS